MQAPRAGRARAPWSCMHTMLACLENRAVQQPATARARRRTELGNRRRTAGSSPAVRRFDYYPQKGRTSRTSLLCTAACMENRRFVDRSHMGAKARLGLQPMQPRRRGDPSPRGCSPDATRAVVEASPRRGGAGAGGGGGLGRSFGGFVGCLSRERLCVNYWSSCEIPSTSCNMLVQHARLTNTCG